MSEIQSFYKGKDITCYPGSNQKDEGKLQTEFNMARIITRLSSKNFCIIKPSFEISILNKNTIQVSPGQASINGMDIITTAVITLAAPEKEGKYYIGLKLARNDQGNVLGDLIDGTETTFEGLYLTYFDKKDETDKDVLWLGTCKYDGTEISDIEEDKDKYGRIWAEDILAKLNDPKHPDTTRILLQDLIYNYSDWYVSKMGDSMWGPLSITNNKTDMLPGILMNTDDTSSSITLKVPTSIDNTSILRYGDINQDGVIDTSDVELITNYIAGTQKLDSLQLILADLNHDGKIDDTDLYLLNNYIAQNGNEYGDTNNIYYIKSLDNVYSITENKDTTDMQLDTAHISLDKSDNSLLISNKVLKAKADSGKISVHAYNGELNLAGDDKVIITSNSAPTITLDDHEVSFTDSYNEKLPFIISHSNKAQIDEILGKAITRYDSTDNTLNLLATDVNKYIVNPETSFKSNVSIDNGSTLKLQKDSTDDTIEADNDNILIKNSDGSIYNNITKNAIIGIGDSNYFKVQNIAGTKNITTNPDNINIYNNVANGTITFTENNTNNTASIYKTLGSTILNISNELHVIGTGTFDNTLTGKGLATSNGILTFKNGTNDATITKTANSTELITTGNLKVGTSGTATVTAGQSAFASLGIGGTTYSNSECKIDANGNITTSGNITGAKVYNACYNRNWRNI